MHIVNKHGIYMTLTVAVVKQLDCSKLTDCKVFKSTRAYMDYVQSVHEGLSDDEVSGSELTVWDDGLVENYHIEQYIDINNLASELSELKVS